MSLDVLQTGVEALGWTLLHFLWQGALAGALFALLMKTLARASAELRYAAGLCVFAGLAMTPVFTFWYVLDTAPADAPAAALVAPAVVVAGATGTDVWVSVEGFLRNLLPWLVLAWLAGVMLLSWRLTREWAEVRALVRSCTRPLPAAFHDAAQTLRITFGIRRPVRVLESALVRVPMVIGWLKPVILIPPAALLGLTARQVELLVAHELAHIRRLDYAVNLFQVAIETLLFYHPVVRWMSTRIREERELCCDDLVVAKSGDKLAYARALAEMEGLRAAVPCMGMAADGGQLISRINRLVALPAPQRGAAHWLLGILLAAAGTSVMTTLHFAVQSFESPIEPAPAIRAESAAVAESPARVAPAAAALESLPSGSANAQRIDEPVPVEEPVVPIEEATLVAADPPPETATPEPPAERAALAVAASPEAQPADGPSTASSAPDPLPQTSYVEDSAPPVGATPPAQATSPVAATPDAAAPDADIAPEGGSAADARLAMLREPAAERRQSTTAPARRESAANPAPAPSGPALTGGTPLEITQPAFPRRARLRGIEGAVTVQFTVTQKGRVEDVRIIAATPEGVFDREVADTVRDWRFEPYRLDGVAVDRTIARTIQFQLDGSAPASADTACVYETGTRLCRGNRSGSKRHDLEEWDRN